MSSTTRLIKAIFADVSGALTALTSPAANDNSKRLATTEWLYSAMSNVATAAGFSVSKTTDGYIKFPSWLGGLIIQWGKVNAVPPGSAVTVTFVTPFPNACLNNGATINNTAGNGTALSAGVGTPNQNNMSVFHNGANTATAITWYAIGH